MHILIISLIQKDKMVEADITVYRAELLTQRETSRTSMSVLTNRDVDEDGFFFLNDDEIE